jgi:AcrR family transcriptional regulator
MVDSERPQRADAARNLQRLIDAGRRQFETSGTAEPFEEIARLAGVGKGTLYRHFPTREHLLAALLAATFSGLADSARTLQVEASPLAAYRRWLEEFDRMPAAYRGLRLVLAEALGDEASVIGQACEPMKAAFDGILQAAKAQGLVRAEVTTADLLTVIAALPDALRDERPNHPWLHIVIDGTLAS